MQAVEGLHEPRTQEPDVHIYLPNLLQVKSISERFSRLALATKGSSGTGPSPRLELSANMHGSFRIAIQTDALSIQSVWTGLSNPELDPGHYTEGSQEVREHPSNRMKELGGSDGQNEAGFSKVRIDGKDWSRVLSVGRVAARVIACFVNDTGLILYVYPPAEEDGSEESCLTVGDIGNLIEDDLANVYAVLHQFFQCLKLQREQTNGSRTADVPEYLSMINRGRRWRSSNLVFSI